MFYSHEILTSHQYGVATVWLVSTVGIKCNAKKISRKAIQEVNVQKACEKILQPGAPIALRLQGSLLYGVSRVYSQQCQYVLADAEKVQAHMMAFYNAMGGSENALDPKAGKAKRKELMLQDDPDFDLNYQLPVFELDDEGNLIMPAVESQTSRKTSSQMSPYQLDSFNAGGSGSIHGGLDLPGSSSGRGNSLPDAPFGTDNMDFGKDDEQLLPFGDEERQLQPIDDWGIEIDADGNVVSLVEEPELPQLPQGNVPEFDNHLFSDLGLDRFDNEGDLIMANSGPALPCDFPLPSDPPVPPQQEQAQPEGEQEQQEQEVAMDENANEVQAPARARRQRRRQVLAPDDQTMLTRGQIRHWGDNYVDRVEEETARHQRRGLTATETRRNAFNMIFGQGLASVGYFAGHPNIPHPLAPHFAGEGLQAQLLGLIIPGPDDNNEPATPRGRRRTASEALELEEDEEAARRVRPRLSIEPDAQVVPQPDNNEPQLFLPGEQGEPIEAGRATGAQLSEVHSDLPWNRLSSQIPSSSIKGGGGGGGSKPGSRHVSASPLTHRARAGILSGSDQIERFSDQPIFGSDTGFFSNNGGNFPSSDPAGAVGTDLLTAAAEPANNTSQQMIQALDREGQNFMGFIQQTAKKRGYRYPNNEDDDTEQHDEKVWVSFEDLFEAEEDRKRAVVAQAFHHVLCLATKNVVKVRQDGQGGFVPFGTIRVGVDLPLFKDDGGDDDDDGVGEEGMGGVGGESRIVTGEEGDDDLGEE
ncbi:Rec8 like protein-domain-containing protein [Apiosordaria backusii]|uniref:Rec8 like protein-domain-containing protein n=1 Tax=Apiosordaria backusii TaxID=314023 RepID=A0AA40BNK7_9PEZI|nr:Rec8 like protein-domain-containing protein [Apiosordaria backusii]